MPNIVTTGAAKSAVGAKLYGQDSAGNAGYVDSLSRDIVICGIGDSHTNGQINFCVSLAASNNILPQLSPSIRDHVWAGSDNYPYYRLDSQINVTTNSQDGSNLGLTNDKMSYLSLVPGCLRKSLPLLGDITISNMGIGGASAFTWAGEQAYCYSRAILLPLDGDTITIDGVIYTFKDTPAANYDVQIASTANDTNLNLAKAVNAETDDTGFFAGTPVHPTVYAPVVTSTQYLKLQAKLSAASSNALVASSSNTVRMATASITTAVSSPVNFASGSDTSALWTNAVARLPSISPDFFVVTLGSNDCLRKGYRLAHFQTNIEDIVATIHAAYPLAKIIFVTPPQVSGSPTGDLILTASANIKTVVAANSEFCRYADMTVLGTNGTGNFRIISTDGLHCSHYGYSIMAQLVANKIVEDIQ